MRYYKAHALTQNKTNVCPFSILQCWLIKELEAKKWTCKLAVKILAAHHRLTK